jgi:hypothetical protein
LLLFAHLGLTLAAGRLARIADLAYLALGSMLPDIIDKPLGLLVFGTPAMGRTIAHTFLFLLIITLLAIRFHDLRIAAISGGVLAHLVLDFMWRLPVTLFWPLLGNFPVTTGTTTLGYFQQLFFELRDPAVLVPEVLGSSYLVCLVFEHRSSMIDLLEKVGEEHKILMAYARMLFH